MKRLVWIATTLAALGLGLLMKLLFAQFSPTTLEVAGRLVWSG